MSVNDPDPNLVDHIIQREVISTLVSKGKARFSELKPKRIESNLLMYHLNNLQKRGVIIKDGSTYELTTLGRSFVDRANLDRLVFRVQPKIVTVPVVTASTGRRLIIERTHEPHMNRVGFPSGKLHYGEKLEEAATRELEEKTGLTKVPLTLRGNIVMRYLDPKTKEIINHTIGYVFSGTVKGEPELTNTSKYWRAFWGEEKDYLEGNVFKSHPEIIKLLENSEYFIAEFDHDSDF